MSNMFVTGINWLLEFALDLIRNLSFLLDWMIYGLMGQIYELIITIAKMSGDLFDTSSGSDISNLILNIYAVIGVIMLFKLTLSLLNSIVNPDQLFDQEKGFGKIVVRSIIALTLIVIIPTIFNYGMRIQSIILENNVFERLFVGEFDLTDNCGSPGEDLARMSFGAFFRCKDDTPECKEMNEYFCNMSSMGNVAAVLNDKDAGGSHIYTYLMFLSTIAGAFILLILILFSIDIAIRTIKLTFLQILTPIAVVSYVDPMSSKEGFFKKWVDATKSTYLSLFIRLAIIAFVVFFLYLIQSFDGGTHFDSAGPIQKGFIIILLIIGALIFARQAPKTIGNLFGIEDVGLGSLNPLKKIENEMVGGQYAAKGIRGVRKGAATGLLKSGAAWGGFSAGLARRIGNKDYSPLERAKHGWQSVKHKDSLGKRLGGSFQGFTKSDDAIYLKELKDKQKQAEKYYKPIKQAQEEAEIKALQRGASPSEAKAIGKAKAQEAEYASYSKGFAQAAQDYNERKKVYYTLDKEFNNISNLRDKVEFGDPNYEEVNKQYWEIEKRHRDAKDAMDSSKTKFDKVQETNKEDAKIYNIVKDHKDSIEEEQFIKQELNKDNAGSRPMTPVEGEPKVTSELNNNIDNNAEEGSSKVITNQNVEQQGLKTDVNEKTPVPPPSVEGEPNVTSQPVGGNQGSRIQPSEETSRPVTSGEVDLGVTGEPREEYQELKKQPTTREVTEEEILDFAQETSSDQLKREHADGVVTDKGVWVPNNTDEIQSTEEEGFASYVVQEDDNLEKIAKKHGITIEILRFINPKLGFSVSPGKVIKIPDNNLKETDDPDNKE